MNTKHTLLTTLFVSNRHSSLAEQIDFAQLEEYVNSLFTFFIESRTPELVRFDLHYGEQTPTDEFISNLIVSGSVELLKKNDLLQNEDFIDALHILISAIHVVVGKTLYHYGITEKGGYRSLDADLHYNLLQSAVEKADEACQHNHFCYDTTSFNWLEAVAV